MGQEMDAYLNFALQAKGIQKHRFIRQLFCLSQKIAPSIFVRVIQRARQYRIGDIETIERIGLQYLNVGNHDFPCVQIDEEFENREAYQEGRLSDDVDLSGYDKLWEDQENEE